MGPRVGLSLLSLILPGEAQGQLERWVEAIAWATAGAVTAIGATFTIWLLFASLAIRVGCAVVSFAQLSRTTAVGKWGASTAIAATAIGLAGVALPAVALRTFRQPSSSMVPTLQIGDHFVASRVPYWLGAPAPGDVIVFDMPCDAGRQYDKRIIATAGQTVEVRCGVVYVDGTPAPAKLIAAKTQYDDYDESADRWFTRDVSEYEESLGGHTYRIYDTVDRPDGQVTGKDFPRVDGTRTPPSCTSEGEMFGTVAPQVHQQPGRLVETKAGAGPCEPQLHYVVPDDHVFVLGDNRGNSNDSRYWGSVPVSMIIGRILGVHWGHIGAVR